MADSRSPRDGRYIERLGTYNPMVAKDNERRVTLKQERINYWLSQGAKPSDRVARFLGEANIITLPERSEQTKQHLPRPKTLEKMKEKEEAASKPKEESAPEEEEPKEQAAEEEEAPKRKPWLIYRI